ncbi:MAG TPA: 16S rRNA (cytosine(1402)-N(4))-methyltransferase RsmH [Candidatus Saccharimonadales bacterium]|nr:16S rRNA (cytosine(1402)-N(4))-methyltransferase RsmH [Candidatus Saccharimonadales bacterium]
MSSYHTSVLLQEAVNALQIQKDEKYIDTTLGAGGHTKEIVHRGGIVLGIDQDEEAREEAKRNLTNLPVTVVYGNFSNLLTIARENGFDTVSGVLFDIGVSSHQFDEGGRGFSFQFDTPLDMRMDKNLGVTAADLINGLTKGELVELFIKYGEEKFAHRIANNIIRIREEHPIVTTGELSDVVVRSYPVKGKIHPATKVFQALRIAVNDELNALREALPQAVELLKSGGRVAVITFHSLEDRIVKESFLRFGEEGLGTVITRKPIQPTEEEIQKNKRARSAKLRVFEKK